MSDRRLWQDIDLSSESLPYREISIRLEHMNDLTKRISIRGLVETYPDNSWNDVTVNETLLRKIAELCPSIEAFEVHNGFMNLEDIVITDFPETLKKLVFNDCYVQFPSKIQVNNFFTGMDAHFADLEELVMDNCNWFDTHDLVLFSKLKNLKKLSLRGCESLKECVPYGSISTRFGFKKLEELDVRDTPISDSDIQCFNVTLTLKTLLLECPEDLRDPNTSSSSKRSSSRQRPTLRAMNNNSEDAQDNDDTNLFHIVVNDYSAINVNLPRGNHNVRPNIQVYLVNPVRPQPPAAAAAAQQNGDDAQPAPQQIPAQHPPPGVQQLALPPEPQAIQPDQPRSVHHLANLVNPNRLISRTLWFERRYPPPFSPPRIYPISDRGVCSFGSPRIPVQPGVIRIQAEARPPDTHLRKLVVRYYKQVTDTSLCHLALCAPNLVYLDLTGTSVTREGLLTFKQQKPNCFIVSDHFTG